MKWARAVASNALFAARGRRIAATTTIALATVAHSRGCWTLVVIISGRWPSPDSFRGRALFAEVEKREMRANVAWAGPPLEGGGIIIELICKGTIGKWGWYYFKLGFPEKREMERFWLAWGTPFRGGH